MSCHHHQQIVKKKIQQIVAKLSIKWEKRAGASYKYKAEALSCSVSHGRDGQLWQSNGDVSHQLATLQRGMTAHNQTPPPPLSALPV